MSENLLCELCGGGDGERVRMADMLSAWCVVCAGCMGPYAARLARERRAALAAPSKYYVTQPSPLPETLPVGTRTVLGPTTAPETLVLGCHGERVCYMRESAPGDNGWCWPRHIDWSTVPVPVQEAKRHTVPALVDDGPEPCELHPGTAGGSFDRAPAQCRECSRTERPVMATHGELCVYCAHSHGLNSHWRDVACVDREVADDEVFKMVRSGRGGHAASGEIAARARLAALDKRDLAESNKRANTADAKMLALPHPWACGGEDEP